MRHLHHVAPSGGVRVCVEREEVGEEVGGGRGRERRGGWRVVGGWVGGDRRGGGCGRGVEQACLFMLMHAHAN